jgi:hypothetical protein
MLPRIRRGRARLTGLIEFAHVVDGGAQQNRQRLYPACLVCRPRWDGDRTDTRIARLSDSGDMSTATISRKGLGRRVPATS